MRYLAGGAGGGAFTRFKATRRQGLGFSLIVSG